MPNLNHVVVLTMLATSLLACSKFEGSGAPVSAAPVVAAAIAPEPTHVASECPVLPARYKEERGSTIKYANIQQFEGGVAYTIDGKLIVADEKVHRSPSESQGENYVATCRKGVLKVVVSQPVETADSKALVVTVSTVVTFTKYNEEGDFIVQTVKGEKSDFNLLISAVPSLHLPAHVAAECPDINGTFSDRASQNQSNKSEFSTLKTANGENFRVDQMEFTVDGTHQDTKDGGDRDTYIAVCSKNELKVFMFQDGTPTGSLVFAAKPNGEIRVTEARSGARVQNVVYGPYIAPPPPAPAPAPYIAPPPPPAPLVATPDEN
jgi:hypothetical protein